MTEVKHIRPKKRSTLTAPTPPGSKTTTAAAATSSVKSILKAPKYSQGSSQVVFPNEPAMQPQPNSSSARIVEECVKERPRKPRRDKTKPASSSKKDEPLLSFNTISELMEAAGTDLPPQALEEGAVVEAGLEFSCRDPTEYQEETLAEQYRVFLGSQDGNEPDDKENSGSWDFLDDDDDDDSQGGQSAAEARVFARKLLEDEKGDPQYEPDDYYSDSEIGDEDQVKNLDPKPFLQLWSALSHWVTPDAVRFVRSIRAGEGDEATVQRTEMITSDVEASRCAGLWSTLQMHVPSCWNSLDTKMEDYQVVQNRVVTLLQLFDYRRPAPSLSTGITKALGCIFLDILSMPNSTLPDPCAEIGLLDPEYRYLVTQAFTSFASD